MHWEFPPPWWALRNQPLPQTLGCREVLLCVNCEWLRKKSETKAKWFAKKMAQCGRGYWAARWRKTGRGNRRWKIVKVRRRGEDLREIR